MNRVLGWPLRLTPEFYQSTNQVCPGIWSNKILSGLLTRNRSRLTTRESLPRRTIATSNLLFRFSRPDIVVRPTEAAHVQTIIKETKKNSLKVTVKGNDHSYARHSTAFGGISLDLGEMNKTGCQWGTVYETLINGRHDGYVINGGRCPTVGVSGFILGGGLGPFTRSFGIGCDTLIEAKMVTAKGKLVTVKNTDAKTSDKGRLFWALAVLLKVQKLSNRCNKVVAGRYQWFPSGGFADSAMATMSEFYVAKWPNKVTIDTTWTCDLRQQNILGGVRFNWLEETERAYPSNKTYELCSSFIFKNDDRNTIKSVTTAINEPRATFRKDVNGEQVNFLVTWIHAGGKATETTPTDSAFFWLEAVFHTYVAVEWTTTKVKRALRPLSLNGEAAFINFPDRDFPTRFHEKVYFGGNREELQRVKEIWDPENFFNWVQGVRRPGDPEEDDDVRDEDRTDQLASKQWEEAWSLYEPKDLSAALDELADLGFDEMSE
ncbi:hypothetical protein LCI18_002147 [Fusarium solani-melongenae]|uniref:Uncharacterized protein n=1 Tax=Fusarium solani subsp. cucurbitae TaxID=2747967 RepID=A0ACD3YQG0_FUSSC|nr:hypothetical protein LCI18_002147 [Fusarium solani-melongenae]